MSYMVFYKNICDWVTSLVTYTIPRVVYKVLPQSIYGRFLLIIVFPIFIIQIVTITIFYERHWDEISHNMESYLLGEIKTIVRYYEKYLHHSSIDNRLYIEKKNIEELLPLKSLNMRISLYQSNEHIPYAFSHYFFTDRELRKFLKHLKKIITTYSVNAFYTTWRCKEIMCTIALSDNSILHLQFSAKRIKNSTTYIFVIWIVTTAVLLSLISLFFMKKQVNAIIELTRAVRTFGLGKRYNLPFTGAKEIKYLAASFIRMRKNIEAQIKYRTEFLATVAHDIRTPITRIKLNLELLKEEIERNNNVNIIDKKHISSDTLNAIIGINNNADKLDFLVKNYLDFAKQEGNEKSKNICIIKLLNNICKYYDDSRIQITSDIKKLFICIRPNAIERAICNLLENSIKYANKVIDINITSTKDDLIIKIHDDGPGIDSIKHKEALKPFAQISIESNDNKKDGYGLGLAIAQSIINAHNGSLSLESNAYGGLCVLIVIPK